MLKPPLSLFSHHQQPFQHLDSLHQLGPPHALGSPPMAPVQAIGHPAMAHPQTLGPPPISAPHSLRPPPITSPHSLGPPSLTPAQPLRPPPIPHTFGPPSIDLKQAVVPPNMDLTQPLGPPPLTPTQALVPPPVVTCGASRFPLPSSPLSSPPVPMPDPSQLPPRSSGPPIIHSSMTGLSPGHHLVQTTSVSEQRQDDISSLGVDDQEDSLGLEELCKPLYCKLCNVTLNSAQQAQAHYQVSPSWHSTAQVEHVKCISKKKKHILFFCSVCAGKEPR